MSEQLVNSIVIEALTTWDIDHEPVFPKGLWQLCTLRWVGVSPPAPLRFRGVCWQPLSSI
jgi:hypothetical protein